MLFLPRQARDDACRFFWNSTREPKLSRVLAFDIGATNSRAALVDNGVIVWRAEAKTPSNQGPDAVLATMQELAAPAAGNAESIGIAITGQVVDGYVTAHNAELLPGWQAYPLQARMQAALHRQVAVVNDARAAAWAEYKQGAGRGYEEFLFVTVSSGIGAGLVLGGRLHLARNGFDAELGETLLQDSKESLTLEQLASGLAMQQRALQLGYRSGKLLCEAADSGDPLAEQVYRSAVRALAGKLADMAVMLGITKVAVGGGLGLRPGYLERLQEEMKRLPAIYQCQLECAGLGHDAGLIGAAILAQDTNSDHTSGHSITERGEAIAQPTATAT
jgi:N-acylmannosamine kinase